MNFHVLLDYRERKRWPHCPESVPWEFVAGHEAQAQRNHCQTLKRLNERGGLCPSEMRAVVNDEPFPRNYQPEMEEAAVQWLIEALKKFNADNGQQTTDK